MKILILGGDGMLGHQLYEVLNKNGHNVRVTLRRESNQDDGLHLYNEKNAFFNVTIPDLNRLEEIFNLFKPDVVVNAIGIIKQRNSSKENIPTLEINSLFPHKLAELSSKHNVRTIHISTDCVFDGEKGSYKEEDFCSAKDLYGLSKFLGELHGQNCLTLRTSIIGLELKRKTSLIEWFLAQEGKVFGFKNAIFSGFTTKELSRIVNKMILEYPKVSGLYHVSMDAINKFELLSIYKNNLGKKIDIEPQTEFHCYRDLDSSKFRKEFNYIPPSWNETLKELAEDTKEKYNL